MGIDRRKLGEVVFQGAASPSNAIPYNFLGMSDAPTLEELGPYMQYNPTEARRLLTEAGYGSGLTLELETTAPVSDLYIMVRDMWREIGVELTFREVESSVVTADRNNKRFKHLIPSTATGGVADLHPYVSAIWGLDSPRNWGSVNDPYMTERIERQQWSLDPDERIRIGREMFDRAYDQMHHLWLVTGNLIHVWHPWVFNILPHYNHGPDGGSGGVMHRYVWLDVGGTFEEKSGHGGEELQLVQASLP
jgi:ABC-type transport system substrate-binding protein